MELRLGLGVGNSAKPFYQQQIFGQLRKDISGQLVSSSRSQVKGSCTDSKYLVNSEWIFVNISFSLCD